MTDDNVKRLPTQHPRAPHCPQCKIDLPKFDTLNVTASPDDLGAVKLLGVTLHVMCVCGQRVDMRLAPG